MSKWRAAISYCIFDSREWLLSAAFSALVTDEESSVVTRRSLNGLVLCSTDLPLSRSRFAPFLRRYMSLGPEAKMNRELRYGS